MQYFNNSFGYLGGPDEKIVRFTGGDPLAGVDKDSVWLKFRPGNVAQWNAVKNVVGLSAIPVSVYGFQELSGTTIADLVGSKPLTISGTPQFNVTIPGLATKGISGSATNTNQFAINSTVADASTTEVAWFVYAIIQTPTVGHQRTFHGAATNNAFEGVAGSSVIRYRIGATSGNGLLAHGGTPRPYMIVRQAGLCAIYSDQEKRSITPTVPASSSSFQIQFRISTDVSTSTTFNYCARFENVTFTDSLVKTLFQTLGFTVTGY